MNNKVELKNKVENYFKLQNEIYEYFGYKEDWCVIPIENRLGHHWMVCGPEDIGSTSIVYSEEPFTPEHITNGTHYSDTIYTQRFLPKWVYRTNDYTMICVDTHTDGNKFLAIFDNSLECKDETLKNLYKERWG